MSHEDLCNTDELCMVLSNGTVVRLPEPYKRYGTQWGSGLIVLLILSVLLVMVLLLYMVIYMVKNFKTPFSQPRRVRPTDETRQEAVGNISSEVPMENGNVIHVIPCPDHQQERQMSYATHFALSQGHQSESDQVYVADECMDNTWKNKGERMGQRMSRDKYVVRSCPQVYD